jgi:hypothetical protein
MCDRLRLMVEAFGLTFVSDAGDRNVMVASFFGPNPPTVGKNENTAKEITK